MLIFTSGLIGYYMVPSIIGKAISEQMRLVKGSPTLSQWANPDNVPIDFSVFLFNITNPEEFAAGEKPIVNEVGPYVFVEKQRKLVTNIDRDTVTYRDNRSYQFVPNRSNGSLSDSLYMLNIPLVAVDNLVRRQLPSGVSQTVIRSLLTDLIDSHKESLVIQRNVSEMLFDGYETPMLVELTEYARQFLSETDLPDMSRFGLFYGENATANEWYTVGTGAGRYPIGRILEWNNQTSLNYWAEDRCNRINGTNGSLFAPSVDKNEDLFVFVRSICRSIYMRYSADSHVGEVETVRFTVPDEIFASGTSLPENRCFCEARDRCPEGGLMPVSSCRTGAPIMMSAPHFYQGSAKLIEDVDGVRPMKKAHETYLDVHTRTGLVLRGANRLQVNVDLKQSDLLYPLTNVTNRVVPVAWIEERMEATKPMTDALIEKLILPEKVGVVVSIAAILGGAIGALAAMLLISLNLTGSSPRTLQSTVAEVVLIERSHGDRKRGW